MAKYGMAIDLTKCLGCGACALACKTENNTEYQKDDGRKYNWGDYLCFTEGTHPDTVYKVYPVLCNHCTNAPCVAVCPVTPKAMFKTADGITMHNDERCIGCQACTDACPYSNRDVDADSVQYSVISYNPGGNTQVFYDDTTAVITDGTSTPAEIVTAASMLPPDKNDYTHSDYNAVRPGYVTEKCILCDHRIQNGENPYCVDSCPSGARIFGDLEDTGSAISLAIADGFERLSGNDGTMLVPPDIGTDPNVYYIGTFNPDYTAIEEVVSKEVPKLLVYPNPASNDVHVKFDLESSSKVSLSIYDISGREVKRVVNNEFRTLGTNKIDFIVSDLDPGTYICRLVAGELAMTANFIVAR